MCGIVGLISRAPVEDRTILERMRDSMRHRGPDGKGAWWSENGCVGLGHRRLAIIDLSDHAAQPMRDASRRYTIVFNGEIYNYIEIRKQLESEGIFLRSNSDTEALLEGFAFWGPAVLSRLNGMFAFAIYDGVKKEVFLARDRAGEKPLYYAEVEGEFFFGSEVKALLANPRLPRVIDSAALNHYLAFGYLPRELCMLRCVKKLPPAHAAVYHCTAHTLKKFAYWTVPEPRLQSGRTEEELADELESLLRDSVRRQLVADVPVGVLLSGGLDSSLITGLAAAASGRSVRTFTVTFPGDKAFDEAPHARLIAEAFGTQHMELQAQEASPEILPTLAAQYDDPMGDSSMIPTYLISKLVREHCTVALGGDGGDELFGGYQHYNRLLRIVQLQQRIPAWLCAAGASGAAHLLPVGFKGRNYAMALGARSALAPGFVTAHFDAAARQLLLRSAPPRKNDGTASPEDLRDALAIAWRTPLEKAQGVDFLTYLPDDILVKVDRASMLASLEVRAPLLDYRVIELAFRDVPSDLKATIHSRKILLKRVAAKILPANFDFQRKQGFSIPLTRWLKNEWGEQIYPLLRDMPRELFHPRAIEDIIQGQNRGRNNSQRIFILVMFEFWRRHYNVAIG